MAGTKEVGGDLLLTAKATIRGSLTGAGEIGESAVKAVTDAVVTTISGVKVAIKPPAAGTQASPRPRA